MSLKQWLDNGWLRKHITDKQEISNLLQIVDRDLKDAKEKSISQDWRFGIAYNAALKLCAILLAAEGYRPEQRCSITELFSQCRRHLAKKRRMMPSILIHVARREILLSMIK